MSETSAAPEGIVNLPRHVVDLAANELRTTDDEQIVLRPRTFAVLRVLAENANKVVCKDEVISKVWDDVAVTDDSLTRCVLEIRKAIGDDARRVLRTVPRRGYLLVPTSSNDYRHKVPRRPVLARSLRCEGPTSSTARRPSQPRAAASTRPRWTCSVQR